MTILTLEVDSDVRRWEDFSIVVVVFFDSFPLFLDVENYSSFVAKDLKLGADASGHFLRCCLIVESHRRATN